MTERRVTYIKEKIAAGKSSGAPEGASPPAGGGKRGQEAMSPTRLPSSSASQDEESWAEIPGCLEESDAFQDEETPEAWTAATAMEAGVPAGTVAVRPVGEASGSPPARGGSGQRVAGEGREEPGAIPGSESARRLAREARDAPDVAPGSATATGDRAGASDAGLVVGAAGGVVPEAPALASGGGGMQARGAGGRVRHAAGGIDVHGEAGVYGDVGEEGTSSDDCGAGEEGAGTGPRGTEQASEQSMAPVKEDSAGEEGGEEAEDIPLLLRSIKTMKVKRAQPARFSSRLLIRSAMGFLPSFLGPFLGRAWGQLPPPPPSRKQRPRCLPPCAGFHPKLERLRMSSKGTLCS